jgi:PAS domain S-box-containing protein
MRDKIVNSIDVAPQQTRKQAPIMHPSKPRFKNKTHRTDRDKILADLDLTSNQFKILFENLPQGIALHKMVHDKQGVPTNFIFLASNKAYNDILFPSGNHLGKKPNQTTTQTKTSSVDWMTIYEKVANTGIPESFETYYNSIDKWYQIYVYRPKKPFLISVFMDITKQKKKASKKLKNQKRAKKALLLAEKIYRRFFETSHDVIMARDKEGKMIDCNTAYAKMLGYTKKQLSRLTVQQLLPELWHEQREKIVNKVLKSGRSIVFEREYQRKDGSVFPASVRTWATGSKRIHHRNMVHRPRHNRTKKFAKKPRTTNRHPRKISR